MGGSLVPRTGARERILARARRGGERRGRGPRPEVEKAATEEGGGTGPRPARGEAGPGRRGERPDSGGAGREAVRARATLRPRARPRLLRAHARAHAEPALP